VGIFRKKCRLQQNQEVGIPQSTEQGISLLCGDGLAPGVISDAEIFQIARFRRQLQERRGPSYIASMKARGIGGINVLCTSHAPQFRLQLPLNHRFGA
jgi:hypothetical protein